MPLLAVGSIALDTIETPSGRMDDALGGSVIYFSCAASLFCEVQLVGVVGEDFPKEHLAFLASRRVDSSGIETLPGHTFRWHGRYHKDINVRDTVAVQLNVFGDFDPTIPERFRDTEYVFLANGRPALQQKVLDQVRRPKFVMADTMNHYIQNDRADLDALLKRIDGLLVNDEEARLLTGETNLMVAGRRIVDMGPRVVVVKKGEHGALIFAGDECAALPAYPTERVLDPTGAGDSFAGAFMGYIAAGDKVSRSDLRGWNNAFLTAAAYGTVVASFTVESFGLSALQNVTPKTLDVRLDDFRRKLRV
jgi:sugar/nucleoside kinase (ribokinase family)